MVMTLPMAIIIAMVMGLLFWPPVSHACTVFSVRVSGFPCESVFQSSGLRFPMRFMMFERSGLQFPMRFTVLQRLGLRFLRVLQRFSDAF